MSFKIKRNSWHYWLWDKWFGHNEPKDRCDYVLFQVFGWTLGWVVLAIVLVSGGICFCFAWLYSQTKRATRCPAIELTE